MIGTGLARKAIGAAEFALASGNGEFWIPLQRHASERLGAGVLHTWTTYFDFPRRARCLGPGQQDPCETMRGEREWFDYG